MGLRCISKTETKCLNVLFFILKLNKPYVFDGCAQDSEYLGVFSLRRHLFLTDTVVVHFRCWNVLTFFPNILKISVLAMMGARWFWPVVVLRPLVHEIIRCWVAAHLQERTCIKKTDVTIGNSQLYHTATGSKVLACCTPWFCYQALQKLWLVLQKPRLS